MRSLGAHGESGELEGRCPPSRPLGDRRELLRADVRAQSGQHRHLLRLGEPQDVEADVGQLSGGAQPVDREGRAPPAQQQQVEPVGLVLDERGERGPGELAVVDVVEVVHDEHRVPAFGQLEVVGQDRSAPRGPRDRDTALARSVTPGASDVHGRDQRDAELGRVAVRLVEGQPGGRPPTRRTQSAASAVLPAPAGATTAVTGYPARSSSSVNQPGPAHQVTRSRRDPELGPEEGRVEPTLAGTRHAFAVMGHRVSRRADRAPGGSVLRGDQRRPGRAWFDNPTLPPASAVGLTPDG